MARRVHHHSAPADQAVALQRAEIESVSPGPAHRDRQLALSPWAVTAPFGIAKAIAAACGTVEDLLTVLTMRFNDAKDQVVNRVAWLQLKASEESTWR